MTLSDDNNPAQMFPENILTSIRQDKPWQVAHTKSRREKALAHYLARSGIGYYLPMFIRQQASAKRKRSSLVPVFSGYLFFQANDFERHKALHSNHIARIIEVRNEKQLITELQQIEQVLSGPEKVYPYDFIQKGQLVLVKSGPFKGLEGFIIRKTGQYRLVLSVKTIMQSISVSIEADCVEPISNQK
jgi:transcription antitermination factor NusG